MGGILDAFEERRFGPLTVQIDRNLCVGFGDCIDAAPEIFEFDEEGVAVFMADAAEAERDALSKACAACPVDALVLLDHSSTQLVP
jgi:ferredoxin